MKTPHSPLLWATCASSWSLLCFSLCPLSLILSLSTTGKGLACSLGSLPLSTEIHWWIHLNLLFLGWTFTSLLGRRLLSFHHLGGPCLSPEAPCLSCTEEDRTGHSIPGESPPGLSRGAGSPPLICWQCSPECTPGLLSLWQQIHSALPCSAWCPPGPPGASSTKLSVLLHILVPRVSHLQVQGFALSLVELHQVPVCSSSQHVKAAWKAAQPCGISASPPSQASFSFITL